MIKERDKQTLIQHRMKQASAALREAMVLRKDGNSTLGAVNRAYYAMFYAVLALLQHIDKVPRKHSGAIALFDSEFIKKGIFPKECSLRLHQAFTYRQDSDYHAITPVSIEDTDELIRNAAEFMDRMKGYLEGFRNNMKK